MHWMFSDKVSLRSWRIQAFLAATVTCLLSLPTQAAPDARKDLEQKLNGQLEKKILALRQPYRGKLLQLDSEGNLLRPAEPGGWAGDGYCQFRNVRVQGTSLSLICDRLAGFYHAKSEWQFVWKNEELRVEVEIVPGAFSEGEAQTVLARIFRTVSEAPAHRPPPDLSHFHSERLEIRRHKTLVYRLSGSKDWRPVAECPDAIAVGELEDGEKLYVVTKAVQAPRGIETSRPKYPDEARRQKRNGEVAFSVVIGSRGLVHAIQLAKADMWEFALQAAEAVSRWRFEPARLEGRPVAVIVNIEINFWLQ